VDSGTAKAVEATAKTTDKALTIIHDTGGYLREVIGDLPKNAVGVLGADWLGQKRIRNLDAMMRRTEQIFQERDREPVDQLSPNLATELLSGAQEESNEELIEFWARLLANALDAALNSGRRSFIEAVKRMDPMDAVVLNYLREGQHHRIGPSVNEKSRTDFIGETLGTRPDNVMVSLDHLTELGLLEKVAPVEWQVAPAGREFLRACYPESPPQAKGVSLKELRAKSPVASGN
jgi:hypothetical protein